MRIGILGTGDVGRALGRGFVKHGHEVMIGSRDAQNEKARDWVAKTGERASAGTFADAAKFAEVAVLATSWSGTENALTLAGAENLAGKVVIDATNPLELSSGKPGLAVGHTDSAGERMQRWLPEARVVKCFNTIGNANMVNPEFPGGPPDMFYCGNDAAAKQTVSDIVTTFGLNPIDLGGIESSRYLEPLAAVWILYAMRTGTWNHAFKLLRK